MVYSLLQATKTAAFSWQGFDSTNSSSPPSSSANYCHLQQRDWEEISFCTFSDFLLLFCCLPCCQQRKISGSCENEYGLTPCGFLLWVWSVVLMPLLCDPISCQWHSLNLCFSPASRTTTGGAVKGSCPSPPDAATCIRRKKPNPYIFFFFSLYLPWSQAFRGGQRIIKSWWAIRLGTKPRRTLRYWKAL